MSYDDFVLKYFIPRIIKASKGNIFIFSELHNGAERLILKRYAGGKRRTVVFSQKVIQKNYKKFSKKK